MDSPSSSPSPNRSRSRSASPAHALLPEPAAKKDDFNAQLRARMHAGWTGAETTTENPVFFIGMNDRTSHNVGDTKFEIDDELISRLERMQRGGKIDFHMVETYEAVRAIVPETEYYRAFHETVKNPAYWNPDKYDVHVNLAVFVMVLDKHMLTLHKENPMTTLTHLIAGSYYQCGYPVESDSQLPLNWSWPANCALVADRFAKIYKNYNRKDRRRRKKQEQSASVSLAPTGRGAPSAEPHNRAIIDRIRFRIQNARTSSPATRKRKRSADAFDSLFHVSPAPKRLREATTPVDHHVRLGSLPLPETYPRTRVDPRSGQSLPVLFLATDTSSPEGRALMQGVQNMLFHSATSHALPPAFYVATRSSAGASEPPTIELCRPASASTTTGGARGRSPRRRSPHRRSPSPSAQYERSHRRQRPLRHDDDKQYRPLH